MAATDCFDEYFTNAANALASAPAVGLAPGAKQARDITFLCVVGLAASRYYQPYDRKTLTKFATAAVFEYLLRI